MKIIITENQLKRLILESNSPCPENKKEDTLITINDLKNGKTIKKGYCNSNEDSAVVYIQSRLKELDKLNWSGKLGYFGNKTVDALCDFLGYTSCPDTMEYGIKTIKALEEGKKTKKSLFDNLSEEDKDVVTTLIAEAGGEDNPYEGMQAVANIIKNRINSREFSKYKTPQEQVINNKYDFSCWNDYTVKKSKTKEEVYKMWNVKEHKQLKNAIEITKNIYSLSDITDGATHYYNPKKTGGFPKNWKKKKKYKSNKNYIWYEEWEPIKKIGNHNFGKYVIKKYKNTKT